jgi:long-chain acyl-CoA synthetase
MIVSGDRRIDYPPIDQPIAKAAAGFIALGLSPGAPATSMLRNDFALFAVANTAAVGGPLR